MKILIVGKGSFIGGEFKQRFKNIFDISEFDIAKHSLTKIDVHGIDVVIHVAAIVHQTNTISKKKYFEVNSDLAYKVATLSKKYGVSQFVFFSSIKVFGDITPYGEVWNEETLCVPTGAYGESKLTAETRLQTLNDQFFSLSVIRPCLVYGEGVKANMYNLIRLVDKSPILPFRNLNNVRNMVYIGNLIDLMEAVIVKRAKGIFIATDNDGSTMADMIRLIADALGKKKLIIPFPWRSFEWVAKEFFSKINGNIRVNPNKGFAYLNFKPRYSLKEGIQNTIQWYQSK